jgi:hypothetical protein
VQGDGRRDGQGQHGEVTSSPEPSGAAGIAGWARGLDVAIGVTGLAVVGSTSLVRGVAGALGPVADLIVRSPPARGRALEVWLSGMAQRGASHRAAARRALAQVLDEVVPAVLAAIVDRVDVDAIAQRVDVSAIVDRIDLVALTEQVIDEINLPEIIRESTGSMASDTIQGVRMQGIAGDEAVTRLVDRLLARRHRRPRSALGESAALPADPEAVPAARDSGPTTEPP